MPRHKPCKQGQPGSHASLVDFFPVTCYQVVFQNLAGCTTTLSVPNCFKELHTTNHRRALETCTAPGATCSKNIKLAMSVGHDRIHAEHFLRAPQEVHLHFPAEKCGPRECLGECYLPPKERAAFRQIWVMLHSTRAWHTACCILTRSSCALVNLSGRGWPACAFWLENHKQASCATETWRAFYCSVSSWESVIPFF